MGKAASSALADSLGLIQGYDPEASAEGFYLDARAAEHAAAFFQECLRHVKGVHKGKPFRLEPWQRAVIATVFGWKSRETEKRRYEEVFIFVPRKNGKTTLAAGIMLYMLFCDGEPGAEIYCAASDRDQASLVFNVATGMIHQERELEDRCQIYRTSKTIQLGDQSFARAISAEASSKHGYDSHCVIIDELHAQPNRELVDVLLTSTGARSQPLVIHITTADYDRESICNEKYNYATKVRDGIIADAHFLPVIYEAGRDDDWTSEETWRKANPCYGVSLRPAYMRRKCKEAQDSPAFENTFKRLHLDMRTEQDVRWLQMAKWDGCGGAIDPAELLGRECSAGLDLSSTRDITALVLFFPHNLAVLPFFWAPEEEARERDRRDRVPYLTWARQNILELTPGNVIDYAYIRRRVNELAKLYKIGEIAFDPWNATQIATQLGEEDGFKMVEFRQGYASMNEPSKHLEALVINGKLRHGGHPILRWMASNATARIDPAGNVKIDKQRSTEKVDGLVALAMALGRAMVRAEMRSAYTDRGLLYV